LRSARGRSERFITEEFQMKKLAIALTALAAFTAPALAADMAVKTPMGAAAPVAYVPSWTGCYVGGGGGYGLWNQENTGFIDGPPRTQFTSTTTAGGRGYLGTVGAGCDYQFGLAGLNLVVGAFGDYDWSSIKGKLNPPAAIGLVGDEKMSSAWSVGGRVGWVVLPSLLTYLTGGYTQATFDRTNLNVAFGPPFFPLGLPTSAFIDKKTYKGWFIGAGDEYALSFLPGLFWKTEYRFSEFDTETNPIRTTLIGFPSVSDDSKKWVHTIRSELVYRFNWGGAGAGRY
jgi:outer membrane immunogenic protein